MVIVARRLRARPAGVLLVAMKPVAPLAMIVTFGLGRLSPENKYVPTISARRRDSLTNRRCRLGSFAAQYPVNVTAVAKRTNGRNGFRIRRGAAVNAAWLRANCTTLLTVTRLVRGVTVTMVVAVCC